jgi:hypothetical protein
MVTFRIPSRDVRFRKCGKFAEQPRDKLYQTRIPSLMAASKWNIMKFHGLYTYVLSQLDSVTWFCRYGYVLPLSTLALLQQFWRSVATSIPQGCHDRNTCRTSRVLNTQLEIVLLGTLSKCWLKQQHFWPVIISSNLSRNVWHSYSDCF